MNTGTLSRSERIARLNDRARQAMGLACVAVATEGFRALSEEDQSRVRELVETFDAFTPDNDPYGERDFGAIYQDCDGRWTTNRPARPAETVFWKIDAFAVRQQGPRQSCRYPARAHHHAGQRILRGGSPRAA